MPAALPVGSNTSPISCSQQGALAARIGARSSKYVRRSGSAASETSATLPQMCSRLPQRSLSTSAGSSVGTPSGPSTAVAWARRCPRTRRAVRTAAPGPRLLQRSPAALRGAVHRRSWHTCCLQTRAHWRASSTRSTGPSHPCDLSHVSSAGVGALGCRPAATASSSAPSSSPPEARRLHLAHQACRPRVCSSRPYAATTGHHGTSVPVPAGRGAVARPRPTATAQWPSPLRVPTKGLC